MPGPFAYVIVLVVFVIAINFFMLFFRLRRDRYRKPGRASVEEAQAARWREKELQRRLDREQEEAAHRVELRNNTLALYDQVRRNAAAREKEAAAVNVTPDDEE